MRQFRRSFWKRPAVNVDSVSIRRRWTPYKILETKPDIEYQVFYLFPNETVPSNALLFVCSIDDDADIGVVRDAAAHFMFNMPAANDLPA
jgi:hypothetical protein